MAEEKCDNGDADACPICSLCTLSLPPENIRKPKGFLIFSGGREKVLWEQMGYDDEHYYEIKGPNSQLFFHMLNRKGFV